MNHSMTLVAITGAPAAGKTFLTAALSMKLQDISGHTVISLFPDLVTPSLPILFPRQDPEKQGSLGKVLSAPKVTTDDILYHTLTPDKTTHLGVLGYRLGENKDSYPRVTETAIEEFLDRLSLLTSLCLVDCPTVPVGNPLAQYCLAHADLTLDVLSPDLASLAFVLSHERQLAGEKIRVLNTPHGDLPDLSDTVHDLLPEVFLTLPWNYAAGLGYGHRGISALRGSKPFDHSLEILSREVLRHVES